MQVFHGSYTEILKINLSKSQANKDFGRGFYVTRFRPQAEKWAAIIARINHKKPVVTEFTFYERAFEDNRYKVLRFSDYNEEWLNFVILNRDRATAGQKHDYDIVEGPIADDRIANRIDDYLAGLISKSDFLKELIYTKEETHQICFCTVNSLQMLQKTDTKFSLLITRISEPVIESLITEFGFDEEKATDVFYTSKTFSKLSDKNAGFYLKSWQEIQDMLKKEMKL
ncbi:MAG: DUF3990 domain-containing protein [Tannerella sp.]|jgi:hypothetical protein|nr:DUF3990 domain-containing protein [Tannerella sp.]